MNDDLVLALQMTYRDAQGAGRVLAITDRPLPTDSPALADAEWQARLLGDVRWSEAARHPFMEQGGELSIGEITVANLDGAMNFLHQADLAGYACEMRRGRVGVDRWADMERIFVAHAARRRFTGDGEIVIELESVLNRLAGAANEAVFDASVPNPQLEGQNKPMVIGRVKQAPALEHDPNLLGYYTAQNASKIGAVAEGANPTQRWTLEDSPTFKLTGTPTLPITADFEGPGDARSDIISAIGSFSAWSGGEPNGWDVLLATDATINSDPNGILITSMIQPSWIPSTFASFLTSSNVDGIPNAKPWTVFDDLPPNGVWTGSVELIVSERAEALVMDVHNAEPIHRSIFGSFDVKPVSGTVDIDVESITVRYENGHEYRVPDVTKTAITGGNKYSFIIRPEDALDGWNPSGDVSCLAQDVVIRFGPARGEFEVSGIVQSDFDTVVGAGILLDPQVALTAGERVNIIIDYEASSDPLQVQTGAVSFSKVFPNPAVRNSLAQLDPSGGRLEISWTVSDDNNVGFLFAHPENTSAPANSQVINQIQIIRQQPGTTKFGAAVPYVLEAAGIAPADHLDQAAIDTHAAAAGNPDLGWLIGDSETVDQVLFKLAGSLGGYVWAGLDGKVRSAMLRAPTDPERPHLVIDSSRAERDDVSSWQDPAPGLTTKVAALRNWLPVPIDRQAGITSTWTEADRAAAAAEWRIKRVWQDNGRLDEFRRKWPSASARPPYQSALIDAAAAQWLANLGCDFYINQPYWWEIDCVVRYGELDLTQIDRVVWVQLDYPGLEDGRWLRVLGRAGSGRGQRVTLTLHG